MGSSTLSLDRLKKILDADKNSILFVRFAYFFFSQKSLDKSISIASDGVS